jgi:hypothetical protein
MADPTTPQSRTTLPSPGSVGPPRTSAGEVGELDLRSGNLTPWTPEQVSAWHAREEQRRRWVGQPLEHPTITARRQAEIDAERQQQAAEERRAKWPDPRASLRLAHTARSAAEGEIVRLEGVLAAARQHLAAMEDAVGAAEKELRHSDAEAAQVLARAIAHGGVGEPSALYSSSAVEDARRRRDQAKGAVDIIENQLRVAEGVRIHAHRDVEAAAEQVALAAWLVLSDKIAELDAERAALLEQRYSLGVVLTGGRLERTQSGPILKALISDPETPVPG